MHTLTDLRRLVEMAAVVDAGKQQFLDRAYLNTKSYDAGDSIEESEIFAAKF